MKIGIVSRALIPGGHVVWAAGLARGLSRLGQDVSLIYIRDSRFFSMFESELAGREVEYTFEGALGRLSEAVGWPLSMAFLGGGYGKDGGPDPFSWILAPFAGHWMRRFDLLIFAEDFTGVAGLLSNRLTGTPYVVFVHEAPGGVPSSPLFKIIERARRVIRDGAVLTCAIDEAISTRLQAAGESHVTTVPLGCDPISYPLFNRAEFVLADSRWTPARDPGFILKIAKHTPGIRYLMLGSFWTPEFERSFVEQCRREGLDSQVKLLPNLSSKESTDLYQRAMVYIRWAAYGTGGWEMGFPTGLRLAMSNSCPVIFDKKLGCAPFIENELPESAIEHRPELFALKILELSKSKDLVRARVEKSLKFAQKFPWSYSANCMLGALAAGIATHASSHP